MKKFVLFVIVISILLVGCEADANKQIYKATCYSNGTVIYEHLVTPLSLCGLDNHVCSHEKTDWKEIDTQKTVSLPTSLCVFVEAE